MCTPAGVVPASCWGASALPIVQNDRTCVVRRAAKNPDEFASPLKNTYRVMLTRGLRGCHVYFEDEQTRDFVLSRVEWPE